MRVLDEFTSPVSLKIAATGLGGNGWTLQIIHLKTGLSIGDIREKVREIVIKREVLVDEFQKLDLNRQEVLIDNFQKLDLNN